MFSAFRQTFVYILYIKEFAQKMYTKVKMWDTFCKYQLHTSCRIFVLYTKCIHDFCVGIRLPVSKQYLL